jgi:hypothetical protein
MDPSRENHRAVKAAVQQFRSLETVRVVKRAVPPKPFAIKQARSPRVKKVASVVKEHEQLYLVKKSGNLWLGFLDHKP